MAKDRAGVKVFVAYSHSAGFGNSEWRVPSWPVTFEVIETIQRGIQDARAADGVTGIVVINLVPLADDT